MEFTKYKLPVTDRAGKVLGETEVVEIKTKDGLRYLMVYLDSKIPSYVHMYKSRRVFPLREGDKIESIILLKGV